LAGRHGWRVGQPLCAALRTQRYLMVVNFDIGDDFYVPTDYVDTAQWDGTAVYLTLSKAEVGQQSLSTLPQFVAARQHREEILPEFSSDS
ncbi:MAG: hypothetical protein AAF614_42320, partial [Chloroflexota bacterium]